MKRALTLSISLVLTAVLPSAGPAQVPRTVHSFELQNAALRASIDSLMKWYPEAIVYLDKDVEGRYVSGFCAQCSFDEALGVLLQGLPMTWVRMGNQIILKKQEDREALRPSTVSGFVSDSLGNECVSGATVLLQDGNEAGTGTLGYVCNTNDFGYYCLPKVSPGVYVVTIRALGYRTVNRTLAVKNAENVDCNIGLIEKQITMQEVVIEGRRNALTPAEGISRGVFYRSVPTDQNQYLLDGGRIYNPAHFGGVLSTFSPDVLNDVQIVGGGLPPSFGGRVGSIVDLSVRNGSRAQLEGSMGLGTLGSTLSIDGPLSDNTTFLVSGRRGYPSASVEYFKSEKPSDHHGFTEVVGKITDRITGSQQLSFCGYLGMDSYENSVAGFGEQLNNDFSWNNEMLDVRWIGIVSPTLFLHATAGYSRYGFDLGHSLAGSPFTANGTPITSNYAIENFSFRANAEEYYDDQHTLRAGVEILRHGITGNISAYSSQTATVSFNGFSAWEASLYLQDQWRILPAVTAELGGRATTFLGDKATFSSVDPRFSLHTSLDEATHLYCSFSAVNEFIHPYRNSGVFLLYPTIFWYPSNDQVRPSTSLNFNLGGEKELGDGAYFVSAESFYRITNNLHEIGFDTTSNAIEDLNSSILYGMGRTYGVFCTLQKRLGQLTGSVNYVLSWSSETFSEINGGRAFAPPFDRRHELQLSLQYVPGERWMVGILCFIASEHSALPTPHVVSSGSITSDLRTNALAPYGEFSDINGSRLPGFQRLEFSALRQFTMWDYECQLSFRLLNSYGLLDPFVWKLQRSADVRTQWTASLKDPGLFPLYPALGLSVKF